MKRKTNINKKYTHFAVHTLSGKIVDGWEYEGLDKDDVKYYFKQDAKDNDYSLKEYKCIDALTLFKKGINPYDSVNWCNVSDLHVATIEMLDNACTNVTVIESNITPVVHETIKFNSPINREYSAIPELIVLSEDTESTIEIETRADGSGWFEWDIEELELTESGGLEFEGNRLVGYDGVFELPVQIMDFLDTKGFITEDCR